MVTSPERAGAGRLPASASAVSLSLPVSLKGLLPSAALHLGRRPPLGYLLACPAVHRCAPWEAGLGGVLARFAKTLRAHPMTQSRELPGPQKPRGSKSRSQLPSLTSPDAGSYQGPEVSRGLGQAWRVPVLTRRVRTLDSGARSHPPRFKARKEGVPGLPLPALWRRDTPVCGGPPRPLPGRICEVAEDMSSALAAGTGLRLRSSRAGQALRLSLESSHGPAWPGPGPAPTPAALDADPAAPGWTRSRRIRETPPRTGLLRALGSRGLPRPPERRGRCSQNTSERSKNRRKERLRQL